MNQNVPSAPINSIQPLSNVGFATFLYFDQIYTWIYFIIEVLIYLYKAYGLTYSSGSITGLEIVALFMFGTTALTRIQTGFIGNRTESIKPLVYFLLLSLIDVFGFAFFMRLQSYVLMLEVVMGSVGCVLLTIEFFLGLITLMSFKSKLA